jgi:hypothetical protein
MYRNYIGRGPPFFAIVLAATTPFSLLVFFPLCRIKKGQRQMRESLASLAEEEVKGGGVARMVGVQ